MRGGIDAAKSSSHRTQQEQRRDRPYDDPRCQFALPALAPEAVTKQVPAQRSNRSELLSGRDVGFAL